ncbi:TadE/TadG family type IV pilus assembly protein [Halomonas sp. SpR1]|uniref:TadE/TadG family type IV pilus assembly protein n=1 Tax=Halomonas sp. SpR1 TaxID=3050462 RepID=UPI0027E41792|nr:TadE/TadG family type IV pilus assembly protein [Halomonas sp. SpR1]MDQ7735561.1 TadE/TadG family type IV pilus assembly protein [Halomonas sp. SpR1]
MKRQSGQGTVEFVVIMLLFLAFLGGIFEMTRIFRAKHTLNESTFLAAREGALNHAQLDSMVGRLGEGMADLFIVESSLSSLTEASLKSSALAYATQAVGGGVEIVSPTKAVFDQLSKELYIPFDGSLEPATVRVIPNDNLRWRPNDVASLDDGESVNLKDANLLKIRTTWCQKLVVPGLDYLIYLVADAADSSGRQSPCQKISIGAQLTDIERGWYIAVTSDATVRMQTPVLGDDLP